MAAKRDVARAIDKPQNQDRTASKLTMPTMRPAPKVLAALIAVAALLAAPLEDVTGQDVTGQDVTGQDEGLPSEATFWRQVSSEGIRAYVHDRTLWLRLDDRVVNDRKAVIPRLCAPLRSIRWRNPPDSELKVRPEPGEWVLSWDAAPAQAPVIELVFDEKPTLLADCPKAVPAGDGSVMLHAYQAGTFGEKLRYEPQWYKNTVGYWTVPTDYAMWNLTIDQPGSYAVAVLQGCGAGQGGSEAVITLRHGEEVIAELPFKTIDTGHFQNFRWNHLGMIDISSGGDYQLRIGARRIAKAALFDVRAIHLVRQAESR